MEKIYLFPIPSKIYEIMKDSWNLKIAPTIRTILAVEYMWMKDSIRLDWLSYILFVQKYPQLWLLKTYQPILRFPERIGSNFGVICWDHSRYAFLQLVLHRSLIKWMVTDLAKVEMIACLVLANKFVSIAAFEKRIHKKILNGFFLEAEWKRKKEEENN